MSVASTSIQWTDATWNPTRGCSRVSPGCANCYAENIATRFSKVGQPFHGFAERTKSGEPHWTGKVELVSDALNQPLRWKTPRRIFVNSMSDLFHESLDYKEIAAVVGVMAAASYHAFQVLTKRPQRMWEFFGEPWRWSGSEGTEVPRCWAYSLKYGARGGRDFASWPGTRAWPLPNVWLGVSVENQETTDERIPLLLDTPAAIRFLSVEPILGPVDLTRLDAFKPPTWPASLPSEPKTYLDALRGNGLRPSLLGVSIETHIDRRIDWVIVGGESGAGARPCDARWIDYVVGQCRAAHVPVFVKQLGSYAILDPRYDRSVPGWTRKLRDRKGGDMSEWPEDLRVREFPNASAHTDPTPEVTD